MPGNTLLASLPNPAEFDVVAFGAALGAFAGNASARLRREQPERRVQWSLDMGFYLTGLALLVYLVANLREL